MTHEKCPFDEIHVREPQRIINVGLTVVSFLSNPRITEGHVLVVPRRHVEPPHVLAENEIIEREREIERLSSLLYKEGFSGVDVLFKPRPAEEQGFNGTKVDHAHWHVLPSKPGEDLYEKMLNWSQKEPLTNSERDKWTEILRP